MLKKPFVTVCATIILSACVASSTADVHPTAAVLSLTITPTAQPTDTPTSIPTPSATPRPDSVLPSFTDSSLYPLFITAPDADPDCRLPCWQGLRINVSTKADVQKVLSRVFNAGEEFDFFDPPPSNDEISDALINIPEMIRGGHTWELAHGIFQVYALIDAKSGLLSGLEVQAMPFNGNTFVTHNTRDLIVAAGQPSRIYVKPEHSDLFKYMLVYEDGLVTYIAAPVTDEKHTINGSTGFYADLCLDKSNFVVNDFLMAPFHEEDSESLDPVQWTWFGFDISRGTLISIDEGLGISVEEFTEVALHQDPPCILLDYTRLLAA